MNTKVFVSLIALAALSGCSVAPSKLDAGWGHNSYPELGYPFGPANEEDTLDTLGLRATWERGKCFAEVGLGYKLRDGGFYGDSDVVFTSRVGVVLWKR